ncbi:hypothetical protein EDC96DRAFT_450447 [Choanephora cucurbitarum]|nr:hypothetical protein EDC96DRAFT_450447 [Choanephora cucurbitarum]
MEVKNKDVKPSQAISDNAKIAMCLKKMLDEQVAFGVEDPVALGLEVEGEKVKIFAAKLEHEGVYQVHLDSHFFLPRDCTDICSIPRAMQCLNKVSKTLKGLKKRLRSRNNSNSIPTSWRRPSFDWPVHESE